MVRATSCLSGMRGARLSSRYTIYYYNSISPVCLSVRYCSSRDNVKDLKFIKHLICCRLVHLLGGRRHLRLQSRERDLLQRHL